jgi:hypothetical protein
VAPAPRAAYAVAPWALLRAPGAPLIAGRTLFLALCAPLAAGRGLPFALRALLAAHLAAHGNFLRFLWATQRRALHFPLEIQRLVFDYAFANRAHKLDMMRAAAAHLESAV